MIRGKVYNRNRKRQILDFSGIQLPNKITPTDIDCLISIEPTDAGAMIEFRNKGYIFIETKFNGTKLPWGQDLALRRIVADLKKPAMLLITSHDVADPSCDVDLANTTVVKKIVNEIYDPSATGRRCIDEIVDFVNGLL